MEPKMVMRQHIKIMSTKFHIHLIMFTLIRKGNFDLFTLILFQYNYLFYSIPSHLIGPWAANTNNASGQGFIFQFPRTVTVSSTKTKVSNGAYGIWSNGLAIYSASDAQSFKRYI